MKKSFSLNNPRWLHALKNLPNMAKQVVEWASYDGETVNETVYNERLKICRSCEHFINNNSCGICGCYMIESPIGLNKIELPNSVCADNPPRWQAVEFTGKAKDCGCGAPISSEQEPPPQ